MAERYVTLVLKVDKMVAESMLREPRHILHLGESGWTLIHPLDCRAMGDLDRCPVALVAWSTRSWASLRRRYGCGRYPVTVNKTGGLSFHVEDAAA